jgi:hypothetical protein
MKWFYRWLANKCRIATIELEHRETWGGNTITSSKSHQRKIDNSDGITFTLHRANGGIIVDYNVYDKKQDEYNNTLHIITNESDLGEELSKILTLELLRR